VLKRLALILLAFILILGGRSFTSCATSESPSSSPPLVLTQESFSTIVKMNGKELTVGAPEIVPLGEGSGYPSMVTVVIKNSGHEPIALVMVELEEYDSNGLKCEFSPEEREYYKLLLSVKDLSLGEVQTLHWDVYGWSERDGSFKVKVKKLE